MTRLSWAAAAVLRGGRPRSPSWPRWPVRRFARRAEPEAAAEPIPFSSSKASPRVWSVARSMGSDHQRPWGKVLPVSLLVGTLLLWCVFREETQIDERLGALLSEQVPGAVNEAPPRETPAPGKGAV